MPRRLLDHLRHAPIFLAVVLTPPAARGAGDSKWIDPATGLLDDLTAGLIKIGMPLLGIAVIALGIWAAFQGRMDFMRVAVLIFAGFMIALGSDVVANLFS